MGGGRFCIKLCTIHQGDGGIWLVAKKAGTPERDQTALCGLLSACEQPSYPPVTMGVIYLCHGYCSLLQCRDEWKTTKV